MNTAELAVRDVRPEPPITPAQLRDIALFGALSDEVLEHFARSLRILRVPTGDMVFREGERAHELFVVLEGEMEVLKRSRRGRDMRVAILGPCDVFGEMSVIDLKPRSASVRAVAPARLLRVSSEDLDGLYRLDVKAYALVVLNIARDLSRRLRVADGLLVEIAANVLDEYVTTARGTR